MPVKSFLEGTGFVNCIKPWDTSTELERRGENVQKRRGEVNMCKLVTSLAKTTKGRIGPSQTT